MSVSRGALHVVSNIGVYLSITSTIEGVPGNYLLVVSQKRKEHGDAVLKPVAGYHNCSMNFLETVKEELGEEVINVSDNKILLGRGKIEGSAVKMPAGICDKQEYVSQEQNILVSTGDSQMPWLPSADSLPVMGNPSARMMYFSPFSSAQLIFPVHLHLLKARGNLFHTEDSPNMGVLETRLNQEGLVLLEMRNSRLTGQTYRFVEGNLIQGPRKEEIVLCEAFTTPSYRNIIARHNIPFEEYLHLQKNK